MIEYEFFYQAGEVAVHPTLDRNAFVLTPDGIRIHQITNGKFEQTDLSPVNLSPVNLSPVNLSPGTESRNGNSPVPLLDNQWNRMQLKLVGGRLQLVLNGTTVHEHALPELSTRYFGLFYYADQTSARDRNIVYRGSWPRSLPAERDQQLADKRVFDLDKSAETLTAEFKHSFITGGLPAKYFAVQSAGKRRSSVDSQGLLVTALSDGKWDHSGVSCNLQAVGDFDVIAEYKNIVFEGQGERAIMLKAVVGQGNTEDLRVVRLQHGTSESYESA